MHSKLYGSLERGSLLIASPDYDNGPLSKSVILLCEQSVHGSFGLMLNKSVSMEDSTEVLMFDEMKNPKVRICMGGPVKANQMMIIHSPFETNTGSLEICKDVFLGGGMSFLQESINDPDGPNVILCFGYTGWQASQLEQEFLDGLWFLSPASYMHVFEKDASDLWSSILQEMGGKFTSLATIPDNIYLN